MKTVLEVVSVEDNFFNAALETFHVFSDLFWINEFYPFYPFYDFEDTYDVIFDYDKIVEFDEIEYYLIKTLIEQPNNTYNNTITNSIKCIQIIKDAACKAKSKHFYLNRIRVILTKDSLLDKVTFSLKEFSVIVEG